MYFTKLALLAFSACAVQGIMIPMDAEDGLYIASETETGEHASKLIARHDNSNGNFMNRRKLDSRNDCPTTPLPEGEVGCEGQGIDYSELSRAQAGLENYCGCSNDITDSRIFYKYGNAVAYSCRYTKSNTCNKAEAQAAWRLIAGNCGVPSAPAGGWYWLKDWEKNYGYTDAGSDFCTNL